MPANYIYRFNGFTVDVPGLRVLRAEKVIPLEPQNFRLLEYLIAHRDRVVTKEEIFRVIWEGRAVSDNALTRAVAQIRKALDDDPRNPFYINTVPTVGYRFVGVIDSHGPSPPADKPEPRALPVRRFAPVAWLGGLILLAAVAIGLLRSRPKALDPAKTASDPVILASSAGELGRPSFSPDGRQIAYSEETDGKSYIYVRDVTPGATPQRLGANSAPERWPAWSPDGRTIAFLRYDTAGVAQLVLIDLHRGPQRILGQFRTWLDSSGQNLVWSSNSKWLALPVVTDQGVALQRVNAETGQVLRIVAPETAIGYGSLSLSPDGAALLYVAHPPYVPGELWSVAVNPDLEPTGAPTAIPLGERRVIDAAYSSVSREVLAVPSGGGLLRINPLQPQTVTPVSLGGQTVMKISVYPHAERAALIVPNPDSNLWRLDLRSSSLRPRPLIALPGRETYPKYSPDGRLVAFSAVRNGTNNIWVANADGNAQREVTFMKHGITSTAHWSPDGRSLVFDSNASGAFQIYTVAANGGEPQQLTHSSGGNFSASWSRDGQWIYYTSTNSGRGEVWKVSPKGGTPIEITRDGGWMPTESEDGRTLFYCKMTSVPSLWNRPVHGGEEQQLLDSLFRTNFAIGRQGIFYVTAPSADNRSELRLYNPNTGRNSLVLAIGRPDYGMDISPDGRYLTYAQVDFRGSRLMLVDHLR